jgi:O-acetylserine/cysteine efflux transporter
VLSFIFEGWSAMRSGTLNADGAALRCRAVAGLGHTLFGCAAWGWLLAHHLAATVSPVALLVPVIGMATAALMVTEPMPVWKLAATALVLAGLAINVPWPRWRAAPA